MGDPLSVAASIAGLLAAAAQISSVLVNFGSSVIAASQTAHDLRKEVEGISIVMRALEGLLFTVEGDEARNGKRYIATVDFAMLLMGCMETFSRLNRLLDEATAMTNRGGKSRRTKNSKNMGVVDSLMWVLKGREREIEKVRDTLMRQNSLLFMMVEIIRCRSEIESQDPLLREFNRQIARETRKVDKRTSRRLRLIAHSCDQSIRLSPRSSSASTTPSGFSSTTTTLRNSDATTVCNSGSSSTGPLFHKDHSKFSTEISAELWTSSVYRRSMGRIMDSVLTLDRLSEHHCGSMLSKISISQISDIAIFELPIYANDFYNGSVYLSGATDASSVRTGSFETARSHATLASIAAGNKNDGMTEQTYTIADVIPEEHFCLALQAEQGENERTERDHEALARRQTEQRETEETERIRREKQQQAKEAEREREPEGRGILERERELERQRELEWLREREAGLESEQAMKREHVLRKLLERELCGGARIEQSAVAGFEVNLTDLQTYVKITITIPSHV